MRRAGETVAVIGGGITGLTAAHALSQRGYPVVLVEAQERLGGKVRTDEIDGVPVEAGADSFLAGDPAPVELCRSLGLEDELVGPAVFGASVWLGGKLRDLPAGSVYGIPLSPLAALRTGLLGLGGAARAYADLVLPGPLRGADVSVASLVRRRLGAAVLERMVDPLLAGTRAGNPEHMSLAAALPQVDEVARSKRSLLLGLRREASSPPTFLTVRGGMRRLIDALAERSTGAEVVTGDPAETIESDGRRHRIGLTSGSLVAAAVVLAVPAFVAARLVQRLSPEAAAQLGSIAYASVAVVTLVYPPGSTRFPPGSGVLVPSSEESTLAGCTWYSQKWPHAAPPDESSVVRCFVGRGGRHPALGLPDADLVAQAATEVGAMLDTGAPPHAGRVTRWDRALPQYEVGHLRRVRRIRQALARHPRILLAGAGYEGSGVADCIRQGQEAAGRAAEVLPLLRR